MNTLSNTKHFWEKNESQMQGSSKSILKKVKKNLTLWDETGGPKSLANEV